MAESGKKIKIEVKGVDRKQYELIKDKAKKEDVNYGEMITRALRQFNEGNNTKPIELHYANIPETTVRLLLKTKMSWIDPESHIDWDKEVYYVLSQSKRIEGNGKGKKARIKIIPRIVICLLKDDKGNVARGVAICSMSDQFDLEQGKEWAYGYAVDAMTECGNMNLIVRDRSKYILELVKDDPMFLKFRYHSAYFPNLYVDLREDDDFDDKFDLKPLKPVKSKPVRKKRAISTAPIKLSLEEKGMLYVVEVVS